MRLSILGGGFMGEAIIDQVIAARRLHAGRGAGVRDPSHRREYLAERYKVTACSDYAQLGDHTDALVLAIKPQDFPVAATACAASSIPSSW